MTRFALALILFFIAPSAWAQSSEIPDPVRTPGVIAEDGHDAREICGIVDGLTYSKRHRQTPSGLKAMIRKRDHAVGIGEVDHRLPLALGGRGLQSVVAAWGVAPWRRDAGRGF